MLRYLFQITLCSLFSVSLLGCREERPDTIIKGVISDSLSGTPLPNISVQLRKGVVFYTVLQEARTDANGIYHIRYDTPKKETGITLSSEYLFVKIGELRKTERVILGSVNTFDLQFALKPSFAKIRFHDEPFYDSIDAIVYGNGDIDFEKSYKCGGTYGPCPDEIIKSFGLYGVSAKGNQYRNGKAYDFSLGSSMSGDTGYLHITY